MAEGARLESVFRGNSNLGSNPSLSATLNFRRATPEQPYAVLQLQCLQKPLTAVDIARVFVFLATRWSDGITGRSLNVDGGWIMHQNL